MLIQPINNNHTLSAQHFKYNGVFLVSFNVWPPLTQVLHQEANALSWFS